MAKRAQRWPIWRIVLLLVGAIGGAVALFVSAYYVRGGDAPLDTDAPPGSATVADYIMSNLLMLLGAICCGLVLICIGWLVVRYYQSIPAWKKRAKLPAHRRK